VRFPNGYTTDQPPPDLRADEHFHNWMRTAGLPTFTKLFGRNDQDQLIQGRYQITINMSMSPPDILYIRWLIYSRLPRQIILGYQIDRDIHRVVDWG